MGFTRKLKITSEVSNYLTNIWGKPTPGTWPSDMIPYMWIQIPICHIMRWFLIKSALIIQVDKCLRYPCWCIMVHIVSCGSHRFPFYGKSPHGMANFYSKPHISLCKSWNTSQRSQWKRLLYWSICYRYTLFHFHMEKNDTLLRIGFATTMPVKGRMTILSMGHTQRQAMTDIINWAQQDDYWHQ